MNALLVGATGAVGKEVLSACLSSSAFSKVTVVGRRTIDLDSPKLTQHVVDFDNLDGSLFKGFDKVFCTLGTTRADSKTQEDYIRIDQTYVLKVAELSHPTHFFYCSAVGAKADSWFFYPRTKGQTEQRLKDLNFPQLSIFRPAYLKVTQPRSRPRSMEQFLDKWVMPMAERIFGEARIACRVDDVAQAMFKVATDPSNKESKIYSNEEIINLARTP